MGRRLFSFNPPDQSVGTSYHSREIVHPPITPNRFIRNCVLDGKVYGVEDMFPAFLKGADAVSHQGNHTYTGFDIYNGEGNAFGDARASADLTGAKLIFFNKPLSATAWTPGGNGANAWAAVRLPEATTCESYLIWTKSAEAPLGWRLEGSHTGNDADWVSVHQVDNSGAWAAAGEPKTFTIPPESRGAYKWYRLKILSSNSSTMKLYQLRLFRAGSVCGRGELLLDASTANPLVFSFADGYTTEGAPIDHMATLNSPLKINVANLMAGAGISSMQGVMNVYARRDQFSGDISFMAQVDDYGDVTQYKVIPPLTSNEDKGFVVSGNLSSSYPGFRAFDGNYGSYSQGGGYDDPGWVSIRRADNGIIRFNGVRVRRTGDTFTETLILQCIDVNNNTVAPASWAPPVPSTTSLMRFNAVMARSVTLRVVMTNSRSLGIMLYELELFNFSERYKYFSGKMHRQDLNGIWQPEQVIHIGSFCYNKDASEQYDVYNAEASSQFIRANGMI